MDLFQVPRFLYVYLPYVSNKVMVLLEYTAGVIKQKAHLLFSSKRHIHTLFPWERPLSGENLGLYSSGWTCEGKKRKNGKWSKNVFLGPMFIFLICYEIFNIHRVELQKSDWALIHIIMRINVNAACIKGCTTCYLLNQLLKPILLDLSTLLSGCKWTRYKAIG